jgi:hypothetical protein
VRPSFGKTLVNGGATPRKTCSPGYLFRGRPRLGHKPHPGSRKEAAALLREMFIEAEDDPFIVFNRRLHAGNGRKDNRHRESTDDVQPKASIPANTGAGRDVFWDRYSPPYVFLRNASTYPISPTFSARNTEGAERGYLWNGLSRQMDCDPGLLGQRAHVPYRRWR